DNWQLVSSFSIETGSEFGLPDVPPNVDCHPASDRFAVPVGARAFIFEFDYKELVNEAPTNREGHYSNAKVVLVGNSSVGKSGLGLVLSGKAFRPTESTHGRHIWPLEPSGPQAAKNDGVHRETLLWDLAGQPGYRLIHQLHLSEVAVALVLFDSRSETDPFAGVRHWDRALRQSRRVAGDAAPPAIKFPVAAGAVRGRVSGSRGAVQA